MVEPFPLLECRSLLALGGARSGKSRYARLLAEAAAPTRLMIATASADDDEMAARIARHRAERGEGWETIEERRNLVEVLRANARRDRAIVVDCLTLWLANLAFAGCDVGVEMERLGEAVAALAGPVVFVSNEVGLGIVPETPLGRDFRDWQGRLNQRIAAACDVAVFVVAGLPIVVKPAATPRIVLR
ncbi:MAG TPA: bifunctional adenosylcobinamide kinase/adenosylcobinamide-phosphate guanylyltransferase [Roseiarcus sp.]|nr:bifunctional adenosylcobinamide kinase/adenosylcobinamide-phosphate guanylyltransferase [Roseiarcus sp.]